jgi:hypothetical protein
MVPYLLLPVVSPREIILRAFAIHSSLAQSLAGALRHPFPIIPASVIPKMIPSALLGATAYSPLDISSVAYQTFY